MVAVALTVRERTEPGHATLVARVLRDELGLAIPDALAVASWAAGPATSEEDHADLRSRITTPLHLRNQSR
ncbi:hypothetical protein [Krasilnikovia sp. MM14-A1259]|uniref:hypothetical protein n=1 Tax=Krasilnikovia sp. MM14-A1259 TaxID=3373539 RepID=UPI00381A59F6